MTGIVRSVQGDLPWADRAIRACNDKKGQTMNLDQKAENAITGHRAAVAGEMNNRALAADLRRDAQTANLGDSFRCETKALAADNRAFGASMRQSRYEDELIGLAEKGSDRALRYMEGVYGLDPL